MTNSPCIDSALDTDLPPDPPIVLGPHNQALQRLISCTVPQGERASLIETIFSDKKVTDLVDCLRSSDVQTFIDVIDEALNDPSFSPKIRGKCVRSLYKMCSARFLLPKSLQIEVRYDLSGVAHCRGGFADVWKGSCGDREVAVKVLRVYANNDLRKITRRFCKELLVWRALDHPNVLPLLGVEMTETRFAMVSEWMPNGNVNQFVAAHPDANRFELLGDVARGLIYMHGQGMIHGDLKGLNILVDQTCHARLTDFGLLTVLSDSGTSASFTSGGTTRWMSPELFDSEAQGGRPTKYSDCYALGMVIYEVLSGRVPLYQFINLVVPGMVFGGRRPGRPEGSEGVWFTNELWAMLERCWAHQPNDRPGVEEVLQCLDEVSMVWTPPPQVVAGPSTIDSPVWNPFDTRTGQSTDWSDVSSPSQVAPSQQSEKLPLKAPSCELSDNQGPGVRVEGSDGSNLEQSPGIVNEDLEPQHIGPLSDINSLDEMLETNTIPPREKPRFLNLLCKNVSTLPKYGGGFADVYLGECDGHPVAIKVMRFCTTVDAGLLLSRFCREAVAWRHLRHPNILPLLGATLGAPGLLKFALVSEWMDNGNINEFIRKHVDTNRAQLLVDAAHGLEYLHSINFVHGDLKGANVLVNKDHRACLADFGLSTIAYVAPHIPADLSLSTEVSKSMMTSEISLISYVPGGTVRWMSPERLFPEALEFDNSRPTKQSDCYEFGMVIYEVLCGKKPYWEYHGNVAQAILEGVRPKKPDSAVALGFTDGLWWIVKSCWEVDRDKRPDVETVLPHLTHAAWAWDRGR